MASPFLYIRGENMIESGTLKLNGVIQLRGGISSVLSTVNPLVKKREIMVEIDIISF